MASLSVSLLFAVVLLSAAVSVKGAVDPPGTPVVRAVSSTTVVYMFQSSPTAGATYEVTFTSNRTGVPNLGPDTVGVSSGRVIRSTAGLTPATDYTLSVVAVSGVMRSSAVTADFTTKPAIPSGPPQNVTCTNITSSSITIEWEEPSPQHINDKQGITGYHLKVDGRTVGSTTTRSYTFSNLSPGVEYTLTILPVNSVGTSEDRHGAKFTCTTPSTSQPIITGVLPGFSLVAISWDPPTEKSGNVTEYQVEYKINCAIHDSTVLDSNTFEGFHMHIVQGVGRKVNSLHEVRVRARTEAGYGPYSERVSFVFKSIVEAAVTITGCDSVSIYYTVNPIPQCWNTALLDSVSEVVVSYHESTNPSNIQKRNIPVSGDGGVGQLFISGLTSGQRYRFSTEVVARPAANGPLPEDTSKAVEVLLPSRDCQVPNNCSKREYFTPTRGCSLTTPQCCEVFTPEPTTTSQPQPEVQPTSVTTPPTGNNGAPSGPARNIRVERISTTAVEVTWEDPARQHVNAVGRITGYRVVIGNRKCTTELQTWTVQDNVNTVRFGSLEPGGRYCVRIYPFNNDGPAPENIVKDSAVKFKLPDLLDAPKLVGTALGDRAALLWSEVVSTDEENPVINYIVYPSDGSLPIVLPPTARHHNMFNLTKGETYTVKVAAKSGLGEGRKASFTFST